MEKIVHEVKDSIRGLLSSSKLVEKAPRQVLVSQLWEHKMSQFPVNNPGFSYLLGWNFHPMILDCFSIVFSHCLYDSSIDCFNWWKMSLGLRFEEKWCFSKKYFLGGKHVRFSFRMSGWTSGAVIYFKQYFKSKLPFINWLVWKLVMESSIYTDDSA